MCAYFSISVALPSLSRKEKNTQIKKKILHTFPLPNLHYSGEIWFPKFLRLCHVRN